MSAAEPSPRSAPAAAPTPAFGREAALVPPPAWRWLGRVMLAQARRELAEASRYRMAGVTRLASFVVAALSLYFFSRFVAAEGNPHLARYGGDYLTFALVGLVAAQLQHVAVNTLANRVRLAQIAGFLEAQLATPAPAWMVLGAAPIYSLLGALLRAIALVAGAWWLFHLPLAPRWSTLALAVPLALAAFAGLGLLSAAATMVVRRNNPVAVLLTGSSALLSGVVYPVSVLPGWLRQGADLLPLTHALEIGRRALLDSPAGPAASSEARPLVALALFALVFVPLGLGAFAWALRRARVDGSLTHF